MNRDWDDLVTLAVDNLSTLSLLPTPVLLSDNSSMQGETLNVSVTFDSCGRQQGTRFTNDYHDTTWVTRVSFPIFLLIGTLGNTVGIMLVLLERGDGRRRGSRALDLSRSRKTFLLALFITDLCYLWNRLIVLLGIEMWNLHTEAKQLYNQFFTWTHGLWVFLDALLSFSSQGILVMFCVDRFYAVTCPLQHKTSANFRRTTSLTIVGFIYFASAACSLILPVLYYWALNHNQIHKDANVPAYPIPLQQWRIFDAWFEVFIRIGCAIVIVLLNRLIFTKLKKSDLKHFVHVRSPKNSDDTELRSIMDSSHNSRASASAFTILLCSSLFYLVTNSLDTILSLMQVLSIYPICVLQTTTDIVNACEPARDFLRHTYFAFGFIFYVCLKLKQRGSFRRRHSSELRSSDMQMTTNREH